MTYFPNDPTIITPNPFLPWCKGAVHSPDWLVADTETTGFDEKAQVIELAIIELMSGEVVYNSLLKPSVRIPQEAMNVHHITETMVKRQPTIADEWTRICGAVHGRKLIFYNANYDKRLLLQSLKAYDANLCEDCKAWEYYCAMFGYARFWNAPPKPGSRDPKWQSLDDATRQQGVALNPDLAHRALADCQATRSLLHKMAATGADCPTYRSYSHSSVKPRVVSN